MPMFDFECVKCNTQQINQWLKLSHTTEDYPVCESCGDKMSKLYISAPAFKGADFISSKFKPSSAPAGVSERIHKLRQKSELGPGVQP